MKICIDIPLIIFISFLNSVQSIEPPRVHLLNPYYLRFYPEGQVVLYDERYYVKDRMGGARPADRYDQLVIDMIMQKHPTSAASIRIESVNFSDGDKVIRGDNEHVGTVRSGMIYETSSPNTPMVPIDDDRLVRNGARVAIHIQDRWRSVSQWREGDALARLAEAMRRLRH